MVDDDNRADGDLEPEPEGAGTSEHSAPRRSTWASPASTGDASDSLMSDDDLADALEEDFERSTHTGTHTIVDAEASERTSTAEAEPAIEAELVAEAAPAAEATPEAEITAEEEPAAVDDADIQPDTETEPQTEDGTESGFDPEPVIEFVGSVPEEPVVYSLDDVILPEVDEELGGVGISPAERTNLWEAAVATPEFEAKAEPEGEQTAEVDPSPDQYSEPASWLTSESESEPEPEPQSEAGQQPQSAAQTFAEPPVRRSLPTSELAATLATSAESGGDPSKIMAQLEEQLMLREQDAADFRRWQDSEVAERGPEALADIESAREGFIDIFESAGPLRSTSTVGGSPQASHTFGIDEILDSRLISAPAPMTAPVSDIPPPPGHTLTPMPRPMPTATIPAPEPTFSAEMPVVDQTHFSVPSASVPAASVPPASVPAASVPPASVPAASVPAASVPPASVPAASVPGAEWPIPTESAFAETAFSETLFPETPFTELPADETTPEESSNVWTAEIGPEPELAPGLQPELRPEVQPEPEMMTPTPPTIPALVEPVESSVTPDPFDFDALIGGTVASVPEEPTVFASAPDDGRPISAVVESGFDSESGFDETVSDTDRAFVDLTGPFPVTSEGVTILPQPTVGLAPPLSSAPASSSGIPVVETPLVAPRAFRVEESSVEPTLKEQRVGRASRLFWLWFAANSSIVSVAFGGAVLSLGMSLRQAIVATLIGVAVSFLPLGLGTLAGKWSGQPTMIISRASFGHFGNILPAVLAIIVRVFWGAVLLWFLAAGTARILTGAKLAGPLTETQLVIIGLAIGFLLALVIAFFGYGLIARIQMVFTIISALLIAALIYLTWPAVNVPAALTLGDGPWILVLTGAVLVFSFVGLVWAVSGADLARYQRGSSSGASSMLWSTFGATIPAFVLIAYGAVLAASNPKVATGLIETPLDTISELMPVWYPIPLVAALAFSLLSGVVVSIYSGGFALQATGASMRRSAAVVIVGAAVAALAVLIAVSVGDFTIILRDVATSLAVPIAAWAGIFGAEMMIRNRRFDSQALLKRGGAYGDVRWVNLSMLIVASGVGFGLTTATVSWLGWQGYLFKILGVPLSTDLAASDLGVFAALIIGLLTPIVAGIPAIRRQEAVAIQRSPVVGAQQSPVVGAQQSPVVGARRSPVAAD